MEPEVVHSNPFAALDAAGKGLSADAASERGSDSGSEASTSTAAHLGGHLHGSGRSSAADSSCDSTSGMHSHMDLAAQRKAILASLRRSSIGMRQMSSQQRCCSASACETAWYASSSTAHGIWTRSCMMHGQMSFSILNTSWCRRLRAIGQEHRQILRTETK